jgi:hypothetical protein
MSLHDVRVPTRDEVLAATSRPLPRSVFLISAVLAALGTLVFLFGAFTGEDRVWHAMLSNWLFFTSVSSAAVAFVAAQRITTARWSRPIIRFLEGYVAFLPVAVLLLLVILVPGQNHIFPWTHEAPPVAEKRFYLEPTFFVIRNLATFTIITLLSVWLVYTSVRLDVGLTTEAAGAVRRGRGLRERMRRSFREERREIHSTHSLQGKIAVWLALAFGFGWSVLAYDLSMALDLHFQSTLYGWWFFMGGWVVALMSFTLLVMWWRRYLDVYDMIAENHFHDLGKLCFAFTAFWGYLTFGQYLVIWYGNLGEETHWMHHRLTAPWRSLTLAVVFLMFVLPFFGLLSRAAKVYLPTMALFAICSIVGLWFHRYLEVFPSLHPEATSAPLGLWELGVTLGYLGIWGLCYATFMDAVPRMRATLMTSPFRDEVQVPVDAETMLPLPAHE